jgi:hypothetical protein
LEKFLDYPFHPATEHAERVIDALIGADGLDAVPNAFVAAVAPDRDREVADADFVCR